MRITKLSVASRSGGNGRPGSGQVQFDDGKDYMFCWDHTLEAWTLSGFVRMAGRLVRREIRAPRRAALLKAALDA